MRPQAPPVAAARRKDAGRACEAFLRATDATDGDLEGPVERTIDFHKHDVVAYAFDLRAGAAPALYRRGGDLWLKVTTAKCGGARTSLGSVAFLVPKGAKVNEQTCARSCDVTE